MPLDTFRLLADFDAAAKDLGIPGWPSIYRAETLAAPHRSSPLPSGFGAVYVFGLSEQARCEAGAGRVLKVGRVGANSNARFQSQHYSATSAGSTLARSLLKYRVLWPWLGIERLDESNVRTWMLANLDRVNLYVPAANADILPHLEMYVRARVGSVFEGSA